MKWKLCVAYIGTLGVVSLCVDVSLARVAHTSRRAVAHDNELRMRDVIKRLLLDSLSSLLGRLKGAYNLDTVIDSIGLDISSAVMNYQNNATAVTDKVWYTHVRT